MSKRVLLVEDDALSLKLMRDVLQANGYETRDALDGTAALDAAVSESPDLVVMDIGLPGIDGIETTRRLKANPETTHLPVVAVTAYAMSDDERRMRDAGCDAYLTKPLKLADFLALVDDLLQQKETLGDSS